MNESKIPGNQWFEIPCGNYKVGTWAKNQRAAKAQVSRSGHNPQKFVPRYGKNLGGMTTIVL